jgi:predicted short-subunit dehydrogenase-like oxidoreductase (DUF2520 family)
LGCALALALDRAGRQIDALFFRSTPPDHSFIETFNFRPVIKKLGDPEPVSSEIIIITTQDTEIENAAGSISPSENTRAVLHASGSLPSSVLSGLLPPRVSVGSIHPLISISDPLTGASSFKGAYICVEGEEDAVRAAHSLVECLEGKAFTINADRKALYHAAAVVASGHLVSLIDVAASLMEKCGVEGAKPADVLTPLIMSAVRNVQKLPSADALTGPFVRSDIPAFQRHFEQLSLHGSDNEIDIYLDLALRSLDIAERRFPNERSLEHLRREVSMAKSSRRVVK